MLDSRHTDSRLCLPKNSLPGCGKLYLYWTMGIDARWRRHDLLFPFRLGWEAIACVPVYIRRDFACRISWVRFESV